MDPVDEVVAAIESCESGEKLVYQRYADYFGVNRRTLARRHQGTQSSRATQYFNQTKLTPQQEVELVHYIGDLTKRGLPPTRAMIRNFASTIAHDRISEAWVTRFPAPSPGRSHLQMGHRHGRYTPRSRLTVQV
jgi:AraC-like DNA-binding protein